MRVLTNNLFSKISSLQNQFKLKKYMRIADIFKTNYEIGETVEVRGWIKSTRSMKNILFVDVNDGTSPKSLQLVFDNKYKSELGFGASIEAWGAMSSTPKGHPEVLVDHHTVLGKCPLNEGYPFSPRQSYPMSYIREKLHLRSRVNPMCSALRVRHNASKFFTDYLNNDSFIQIHTPVLTANDCEGAGETFSVRADSEMLLQQMRKDNVSLENAFFDTKTYLTVSGQLHLEAMAHGLGNVYSFGPTFRAENQRSPIHLSEFYMLEVEQGFIKSLNEVNSLVEQMLKSVTRNLLDTCEPEIMNVLKAKEKYIEPSKYFDWLDKDFPVLTYVDAMKILLENKIKFKSPVDIETGINKEQELFLVNYIGLPVFIVDWPKQCKSFYMREKNDQLNIVEALDLLVPHVGELVGGSVREDDYEKLKAKLPLDNTLNWYLDLRKYGGITTGGFGMGFERYLQWFLQIHNIKDVIPFPRWAHNCDM